MEKLEDGAYRLAVAKKQKQLSENALKTTVKISPQKKLIEYDFFKAEYDRRMKEDEERSREYKVQPDDFVP